MGFLMIDMSHTSRVPHVTYVSHSGAAALLPLVLHALQLRLNVLLRDLQEPKHAVVRLLGDHILRVDVFRIAEGPEVVKNLHIPTHT